MSTLTADPDRCEQVVEVLKAVAHPLRLRIIAALCEGDAHVTALAERFGVKQPMVSQQLRILRMHRLVGVQREGGFARYHLAEEGLRDLVRCMEGCSAR